jgi:hypothetical protein
MAMSTPGRQAEARAVVGDVAKELAALMNMSIGELREKYFELYGQPTRTRNKVYLQKRLAWRFQELAEGGLSERAKARIDELMPPGTPIVLPGARRKQVAAGGAILEALAAGDLKPRDRRLPAPGSVLRREYQGVVYEVTVHDDDFEYAGERYQTLSKVARVITGTNWNGFMFFHLKTRRRAGRRGDA